MMRPSETRAVPPWTNEAMPGLHVLAALPDPLHLDGPSVITADLRWERFERAVLSHGGAVRLERLHPPEVQAVRQLLHAGTPMTLLLDAEWTGEGWLLECDTGTGEVLPLSLLASRARAPTLIVSARPITVPPAGMPDDTPVGVLSVLSQGRERFSRVAYALSALAEGHSPDQVAMAEGLSFDGSRDCMTTEYVPRTGGARTFDPMPVGVPDPLPKPLGVNRQFHALIQSLVSSPGEGTPSRGALLYGPAGSGKTTMATAAVRRLAHRFEGGIIARRRGYPVLTAHDIVEQSAVILGVDPEARIVMHHLRRTPMMIVVDDCDRLPPAELESIVALLSEIAPWSPAKLILTATDVPPVMRKLELHDFELGVVLPEDERNTLARALSEELDVPREAASYQTLNSALARFGTVPRAIELFVANNEQLPAEDRNVLLRLFPRAADFLRRFSTGLSDKHRAYVEQLLSRMDAGDRVTLNAISVFKGPVDFDAIAAVSGDMVTDLPKSVERLLERRFVQLEKHLIVMDRMLAGIIQERLTDAERAEFENRFLLHYLQFARTNACDVRKIEEQLANVRHALELAKTATLDSPADIGAIAASLAYAMGESGHYDEARSLIDTAYSSAEPQQRLEMAWFCGNLAMQQEDYDDAGRWFTEAAELASATRDAATRAMALHLAGYAYTAAGNLDLGRASLDESLSLVSDSRQRVDTLLLRGMLELKAEQPALAEEYFRQSLAQAGGAGESKRAEALRGLAAVARMDNRTEDARALLQQALDAWENVDAPAEKARTLQELGALLAESEPEMSQQYLQSAELSNALVSSMRRPS